MLKIKSSMRSVKVTAKERNLTSTNHPEAVIWKQLVQIAETGRGVVLNAVEFKTFFNA
jgi:hypothetical protein